MKRLVLAVAFLLLSCGKATDRNCGNIEMPPTKYIGAKTSARIKWMPFSAIDAACRTIVTATNESGPFVACTGRDVLGWFHIMPQDSSVADLGCILIHEDAHLPPNAWPWNHPGGYLQ